jgi:hypothetical protein
MCAKPPTAKLHGGLDQRVRAVRRAEGEAVGSSASLRVGFDNLRKLFGS